MIGSCSLCIVVLAWSAQAFVGRPRIPLSRQPFRSSGSSFQSTAAKDGLVDQLIDCIDKSEHSDSDDNHKQVKDIISRLSNDTTSNTTDVDFNSLIGYYNVSCTLTSHPQDNPVGGKWTRNGSTRYLWVIRRTLQHVLEKRPDSIPMAIAQAINVIRLDLLFGRIPVWIVLRGDAVPVCTDDNNQAKATVLLPDLSSRAVRVYFDRPRIAFGKFVFSLGPTSSVVLDTPYVDSRIRIGKGGTSGTLFVFRRVEDLEATTEWKWLLDDKQKFITKQKAAIVLGAIGILNALGYKLLDGIARSVSLGGTIVSTLCLLWVALGTGGIETRGETYAPGK